MKTLISLFALLASLAGAQTDIPRLQTNWIYHADYREVGGKTYNMTRDPNWKKFTVRVDGKQNGVIYGHTTIVKSQTTGAGPSTYQQSVGAFNGAPLATRRWEERDKNIAITNVPGYDKWASGNEFVVLVLRAGTFNAGGMVYELWDCGQPVKVPVVSTNPDYAQQIAKTKKQENNARALQFDQDQAAKGTDYGLLRMGERYRDGDGVKRDIAKAREYLTKATEKGAPLAKSALQKLNEDEP